MYRELEELIQRGEGLKDTFTVTLSDGLNFTNDKKNVSKWISDCMNCLEEYDEDEIYKEFERWIRKDGTVTEISLSSFEKLISLLKEIDPLVYY